MASFFIDMLGTKIASILETQKINEDYENKLKPKIKHNTKDFIDAICTYLSNSDLNQCKRLKKLNYISPEDLKTVSFEDPVKYIKDASNKYIEKYLDVSPDDLSSFVLNYKPINNDVTQSGGDIPDLADMTKGKGVPGLDNIQDLADMTKGKGVPGLDNIPDLADMTKGKGVPGLDNIQGVPDMSNMTDISKLTQLLEEKDLQNKIIKTNKAKELYDFYNEETLAKLTCNHEIHEYINDKIINTIFYIALKETEGDKVNKIKSLMLPISQKVTETVINSKLQALEKNTKIYKILFDSFKNQPNYVENMKTHTNAYLLTLLEFFLHFKHNEVLNNPFSLKLKLNEMDKYIDVLRTSELKEMINTELSKIDVTNIASINDLNKLQKNNETDHNVEAFAEFKKLFEEKPAEKKGGKRKQQSKRKNLRKNNRSKKKNR